MTAACLCLSVCNKDLVKVYPRPKEVCVREQCYLTPVVRGRADSGGGGDKGET